MRAYRSFVSVVLLGLLGYEPAAAASFARGHALDRLQLPVSSNEANGFAIDLDGDGNTDNQFGAVIASMASSGMTNLAGQMDTAVAAGDIVHLVELRSSDASFTTDPAATATWYVGEPTIAPPVFDGSDTFRYHPNHDPAAFTAALVGGTFVSAEPATTTTPVGLVVTLQIGAYTVPLSIQGARIAFTVAPSGLIEGQVNGSIGDEEIDNVFVPTLATSFNDIVQADPNSDEAMTLLNLFDTAPEDGAITVEEVATNSLMASLLQPDVDIYDENGVYAPNPEGTSPDSMSFGFGFTAVASPTVLPLIFANGFEE